MKMRFSILSIFLGVWLAAGIQAASADSPVRTLRVLLDPGHGGRGESPSATTGDNWTAEYGRFLRLVNFGGEVKLGKGSLVSEHELALQISLRVEHWLAMTRTDEGWKQFQAMLQSLGAQGVLPRVLFESKLSRTDDYRARLARGILDCDRDFRFFDSPSSFPPSNGMPLHPGRLSQIIDWAPDFVVCVHLNEEGVRRVRGMNALFVPSPEDFEALRQHSLTGKPLTASLQHLGPSWLPRGRAKGTLESMVESSWYHHTGFAPPPGSRVPDLRKPDAQVWNHIAWAYRDPHPSPRPTTLEGKFEGPFWDRERSPAEQRRRGGGAEGVGGDNLFAGQELLRFVRTSVWRDALQGNPLPSPMFAPAALSDRALGEQGRPLCSNWTMPIYLNSVVAYLELGYLSNPQDRWLLMNRTEQYAKGIAAGIYSLASGLKLTPTPGIRPPAGMPIQWSVYQDHARKARWSRPSPPAIENLGISVVPSQPLARKSPRLGRKVRLGAGRS